VLSTIESAGLLDHVDALGKHIATGVEDLGHPLVDHVRGAGLLLGIVLTESVSPAAAVAARAAGFIINAPAPDVIRLAPPLILTEQQADSFITALPAILDTAQATTQAQKGTA
jgi:acetylornithine/N-succinyldiaminopimelate aminotransferase